jgi:hypothetical protein
MEAWGLPQTHWALVSNGANSQRSKLGELGDTWLWCRGRLEVQIPLDDAPCSDSCLHLDDIHVPPLAGVTGAVRGHLRKRITEYAKPSEDQPGWRGTTT